MEPVEEYTAYYTDVPLPSGTLAQLAANPEAPDLSQLGTTRAVSQQGRDVQRRQAELEARLDLSMREDRNHRLADLDTIWRSGLLPLSEFQRLYGRELDMIENYNRRQAEFDAADLAMVEHCNRRQAELDAADLAMVEHCNRRQAELDAADLVMIKHCNRRQAELDAMQKSGSLPSSTASGLPMLTHGSPAQSQYRSRRANRFTRNNQTPQLPMLSSYTPSNASTAQSSQSIRHESQIGFNSALPVQEIPEASLAASRARSPSPVSARSSIEKCLGVSSGGVLPTTYSRPPIASRESPSLPMSNQGSSHRQDLPSIKSSYDTNKWTVEIPGTTQYRSSNALLPEVASRKFTEKQMKQILKGGDPEKITDLLEQFDVNDLLIHAIKRASPETVMMLLLDGADPNYLDGRPLMVAVARVRPEIVRVLVENDALPGLGGASGEAIDQLTRAADIVEILNGPRMRVDITYAD